jgi:ABC-type dipeptide/oligopeptide/nickel transport system permease subunit/ABC-type dipeptide/oligopeptide/nickel transport system permease component
MNGQSRVRNVLSWLAGTALGLWAVASLLFIFLQIVPEILMRTPVGLPRPSLAGPPISLQEQLQLKGPLHEQYLLFLKRLITLDLGPALLGGRPVAQVLAEMVPRTLTLWLLALLLALPLGRLLQIVLQSRSTVQRFHSALALLALASLFLPWWGALLRWGLADQLRLFPSGGLLSPELWQAATTSVNALFLQITGAVLIATLSGTLTWAIGARIARVSVRLGLSLLVFAGLLAACAVAWHQANTLALMVNILHHMALLLITLVPLLAASGTFFFLYVGSAPTALLAFFAAFSLSLVLIVEMLFAWGGMGMLWRAAVRADFPVLLGSFWMLSASALLLSAVAAPMLRRTPSDRLAALPRGLLWVGLGSLSLFALFALAHPLLISTVWSAPNEGRLYDPLTGYDRTLEQNPAPPSLVHLLGTDRWSRDIFSQILYGAGQALGMGLTAALVGVSIGWALWAVLKRFPMLLSFLAMVTLGLPLVPALLLSSGVFEFAHVGLGLLLGFFSWPFTVLLLAGPEPQRWHRLLTASAALTMGYAIWMGHLASFLRLGRFESLLDWGLMLDGLSNPIAFWWLALPPALSISLLTFGCYLTAWGLRRSV